jgi:hypothetical protein
MNDRHRWLTVYLQDHHAAALAGLALFHRVAGSHGDPQVRRVVAELAAQVEEDRRDLERIMNALMIRQSRPKESVAWAGEKLGRLKTNGAVFRRSPLTDVIELEALSLAVEGKALGWKLFLTLTDTEPRLDADRLRFLLDRANTQHARLEELRLASASEVFGSGPTPHQQAS